MDRNQARQVRNFNSNNTPVEKPSLLRNTGNSANAASIMGANMGPSLRALPSLPPFSAVKLSEYAGPTDESNWVIPGMLMAGAYPAANDDAHHYDILSSILSLGLSTFVCLQAEYEHNPNIPPSMWESGYKIRPYIFDAHRMLKQAANDKSRRYGNMPKPSQLDFIHVPIVDCSTTNDDTIFNLALEMVRRLRSGENIYCHCWGGHGRAGTVISVVLGLLYNLSPTAAMKRCQHFHDQRRARLDVPSPQTESQRNQVSRILTKYHNERRQAQLKQKQQLQQQQQQRQKQKLQQQQQQPPPKNAKGGSRGGNINSVTRGQGVPANGVNGGAGRGTQMKRPRPQQIVSFKGNGQVRNATSVGKAENNVGNETPRTRERNAKRSLAPPVTVAAKQYQKKQPQQLPNNGMHNETPNNINSYRQIRRQKAAKQQQQKQSPQQQSSQQQSNAASNNNNNTNNILGQPGFGVPALRPPSRHRPRRPPKTASGVTRRRNFKKSTSRRNNKSRDTFGRSNLDREYRQRPSTAGGLGGKNFNAGDGLLQITAMFPDKASRDAVDPSIFNFSALPSKNLKNTSLEFGGGGGSNRRSRGGGGGGLTQNLGNGAMQTSPRNGTGGTGGNGIGSRPRMNRDQVGGVNNNARNSRGGNKSGGMQMSRVGYKPSAPGGVPGGTNGRSGGRNSNGRSSNGKRISPRTQRMNVRANAV